MAELWEHPERSGSLLLQIDNRGPVPVLALSDVLSALSNDYRNTTGHALVLARVEQGSIIFEFLDWLGKVNDLFDFAKNLGGLLKGAVSGSRFLRKKGRKGDKTVLAIAKLAAETGSEVKIIHKSKDGDSLFVHMNPDVAGTVLEGSRVGQGQVRHTLQGNEKALGGEPADDQTERALEDLLRFTAADEGSLDDLEVGMAFLLKQLVRALQETPRGAAALNRIRARLRASGMHQAEMLLDQLMTK